MALEWWFQKVQEGGAIAAVLLLGALLWMNVDRKRLLAALERKDEIIAKKDEDLKNLSSEVLVLLAEVKTFLFHGGRP
jgi:F0F1-type ATP synthase membrane subunit b/b'